MSAWIVDKPHIDVLVSAARQFGVLGSDQVIAKLGTDSDAAIGQMLWEENHRSVNFRYSENERTPRYRPRLTTEPMHPVAVLKAIGCYDYQSCEHRAWKASNAAWLTGKVEQAILARHPELAKPVPAKYNSTPGKTDPAYYTHPVWDKAPWGYTHVKDALASAYEDLARGQA